MEIYYFLGVAVSAACANDFVDTKNQDHPKFANLPKCQIFRFPCVLSIASKTIALLLSNWDAPKKSLFILNTFIKKSGLTQKFSESLISVTAKEPRALLFS
jgi:hypothetical protein